MYCFTRMSLEIMLLMDLIITTQVTTLAGFADGSSSYVIFSGPDGVATDAGGNIFVADGNNLIRRIDWTSRVVSTVAGNGVPDELNGVGNSAGFNQPVGITIKNGEIWVDDLAGDTIRRIGMMYIQTQIHIYDF